MNLKDDKVPLTPGHIEDEFCQYVGHTANYLVKVAKEHHLNYGKLKELGYLKKKYHTDFEQMLKLVDQGYNPSQIAEFLQARDELSCDLDTVNLERIVEFSMHFSELEKSAESIGECITSLYDRLVQVDPDEYASSSLNKIIQCAIRISNRLPEKTYRELEAYLDSEIKVDPFGSNAMSVHEFD